MTIKLSILYYSRSRFKDYRWIYQDASLSLFDIKYLDDDFQRFYEQKRLLLDHPHLFVRKISIGYAVYRFIKRSEKDFTDTPIYALEGFVVKENAAEIWKTNMSLALLTCLQKFPVAIEKLYDKESKVYKEIDYSLEELMGSLKLENYDRRIGIDKFLIKDYNGNGLSILEQGGLLFKNLSFEIFEEIKKYK